MAGIDPIRSCLSVAGTVLSPFRDAAGSSSHLALTLPGPATAASLVELSAGLDRDLRSEGHVHSPRTSLPRAQMTAPRSVRSSDSALSHVGPEMSHSIRHGRTPRSDAGAATSHRLPNIRRSHHPKEPPPD